MNILRPEIYTVYRSLQFSVYKVLSRAEYVRFVYRNTEYTGIQEYRIQNIQEYRIQNTQEYRTQNTEYRGIQNKQKKNSSAKELATSQQPGFGCFLRSQYVASSD